MACKHLVHGWRGEKGIIYKNPFAKGKEPVTRPCGQCIDCRLNKSREWAIRCQHEATLHEKNCVVTLTYSDENLPEGGSIDPLAGQEFMKKLRRRIEYAKLKALDSNMSRPIKSYGCAEYGCNDPKCGRAWCKHNMRPHYHIILFGHDFEDKTLEEKNEDGNHYYASHILDDTWGLGHCQIMELNWQTAAYVSRYVTKKLTGKDAEKFEEERIRNGRQKHRYGTKHKEQSICISRGGKQGQGIAATWWLQNKEKIHNADLMYVNGVKIKPIKYYDKKFEIKNPEKYEKIKQKRKQELKKYIEKINQEIENRNHTNNFQHTGYGWKRQRAHEIVTEAKLELLKRNAL